MLAMLTSALAERIADLQKGDLQTVEVAVLDSGIDATHPDLAGKVSKAFAAYVVGGTAVVEPKGVPENHDVFGHGTAVASIICGIAKNARLIDYRVLGSDNTGAGEAVLSSLRDAIDAGHRVINMSLAVKADFAPRLWPLCEKAYRRGQVIVAARRNMPLADQGFPAELTSVISVDRAKFASAVSLKYTPDSVIEFVGHGDDVVVAAPGGQHTTKTGTSFATPAVSGMVALLLGAFPSLRPFDVKSVLRHWADTIEAEVIP
jgi:subtilisin family serine protease